MYYGDYAECPIRQFEQFNIQSFTINRKEVNFDIVVQEIASVIKIYLFEMQRTGSILHELNQAVAIIKTPLVLYTMRYISREQEVVEIAKQLTRSRKAWPI
jgi:hypothetical protein